MELREALNESGIYESTPAFSVVFILATIHIFPASIVRSRLFGVEGSQMKKVTPSGSSFAISRSTNRPI